MVTNFLTAEKEPHRAGIGPTPATGALPSPGSPRRLHWVDGCKGICIILVVYGHITGGLEASGAVLYGSVFDRLRSWVYLFHMPAFFFLSGLFATNALKRPLRDVIGGKVRTLAYPYALWTGIYLLVQETMAHYVNNPPDVGAALQLLWKPYGYGLWFLYSLFLISILFHLLLMARVRREGVLALALVLHVAAAFNLFAFWPILDLALFNFVFYAVGGLYSEPVFAWLSGDRRPLFATIGLLSLGLMTAIGLARVSFLPFFDLVTAFLGVAGVVCVARALVDSLPGNLLSWLGFYSLEIYLGHPLFGTASRAVLSRFGLHGAIPLIGFGLGTGLFASLALGVLCRQWGFLYLYRWPDSKRAPNP
jgi:fucose 4-O-acetylase-like acetyltransferase